MIIDLMENILNLGIKDISNPKIIKLHAVSEYDFEFIRLQVNLFDNENIEIYWKIIHKSKIKENIFCSWCFFYENEMNKKSMKNEGFDNYKLNKVVIQEIGKERYKNSILLEIENNTVGILKYGVELHFIDFIKYIENNKNNNNELYKWCQYLDKDNKDILLIGMAPNKAISRSNLLIV